MNRHLLLTGAALAIAVTAVQPIAAQGGAAAPGVSQGTPNISSPGGPAQDGQSSGPLGAAYDIWMTHTPGVTDVLGADHNSAAAKEFGETLVDGNEPARKLAAKLSGLASDPKMSPGLRKEGLAAAKDIREGIETQKQAGGAFQTLSKMLEVIDLTSTLAKAAAYASERDATGAANVLFKESAKKLLEGAGMLGMSWLPGGQLLGTLAGEKIYEDHVEKELDRREQEVREAEYKDRYLNKPWLPVNQVMDERGNVRTVDADMYVDKETGLIKRRTPEMQAAYEEGMKTRWLDGKRWMGVMQDLASGKIDQARYDELRESYRQRDPLKPWNPDAADPLGAGRFAGSYVGRFSGGGSGSVRFTISGNSVSGTLSGVCSQHPCIGDPVSGSFSGTVSDLGMITTKLSGRFTVKQAFIGNIGFSGSLNGVVDRTGGAGEWSGRNKYGNPTGKWSATRSR